MISEARQPRVLVGIHAGRNGIDPTCMALKIADRVALDRVPDVDILIRGTSHSRETVGFVKCLHAMDFTWVALKKVDCVAAHRVSSADPLIKRAAATHVSPFAFKIVNASTEHSWPFNTHASTNQPV